jgi:hypothetical protein
MLLLEKGAIVGSDVTGECYQVTSGRIAEGGFGEIYRGVLLDGRRDPVRDVAIVFAQVTFSCASPCALQTTARHETPLELSRAQAERTRTTS